VAKKIIFLDRDGVINEEVGYLHKIRDFEFIDGVFESLKKLQDLGYEFIVITNQSGIGRGFYTEKDYHKVDKWMKDQFKKKSIKILFSIHCPHLEEDNCNCRKPKPGMIEKCFKKYEISKKASWVIGDSERDIEAGISSGISNTILLRSGHRINELETKAFSIADSIKDITKIIDSKMTP